MRRTSLSIIALLLLITACGNDDVGNGFIIGPDGNADGDTDSDSDTDADSDGDTDADSDGDSDGDTDGDTDTETEECADIPWDIEFNPINMLILLDRSSSMHSDDKQIDGEYYDSVVADALWEVVSSESEMINFGLAVFPSMSCPLAGGVDHPNRCAPATFDADPDISAPVVQIGSDPSLISEALNLVADIDGVGTCGGTPTCNSLKWAYDYFTGSSFPEDLKDNPKFVLLATDGAPNCNSNGDVGSCTSAKGEDETVYYPEQCLDDRCTYNEALWLHSAGIKTFVVGVGSATTDSLFDEVLNNIAYYGGQVESGDTIPKPADIPVGDYYYPATDAEILAATLKEITGEAISCTFEVDWDEIPDNAPDPPHDPVDKACDAVWVIGVPADTNSEEVELVYSYDCSAEDLDADPPIYGWHWEGLNMTVDELEDLEDDTSLCSTIALCDGACDQLKNKEWKSIAAKFGCGIILIQ